MASPKKFFFGDVAKNNEKMQVWRPKKSRFGDDFLRRQKKFFLAMGKSKKSSPKVPLPVPGVVSRH